MANAPRDENHVPAALFEIDGQTGSVMPGQIDQATGRILTSMAGGGSGTVQTVAVATANGFAGTSDGDPADPVLTLTTSVTGILKGNGTAISAVTIGSGLSYDGTTLSATGGSGITVGTTTITSGTNTRILYNNSGVVGEYTLTGSGTVVAMQTAPTFATSITTPSVLATANDSGALGASGTAFSDLFLAAGGVINFDNGDVTITEGTNVLTFAGATTNGYQFQDGPIRPVANDGVALGVSGTAFSDLFLADGGVINWNAGNVSLTHSAGILTISDQNIGTTGPTLELYQDSASPAASDVVGTLRFSGEDSAGNKQEYARIEGIISDTTSTSEDGFLRFWVTAGGAITSRADLTGTAFQPITTDAISLGTTGAQWSDLFLAEGGVINWDNGDVTITQTNNVLSFAGATTRYEFSNDVTPTVDGGAALGSNTLGWDNVFLASGAQIYVNNANPLRSLMLSSSGGKPTTTAGCAAATVVEAGTNDVDYWVLDFDASTIEYAFWNVVMPDNYDGSTITATFYWTASAGSAGNVVWALQGRSYANDEAIDQAWGTAQEVTDAWIANGDVHVTSATAAITLGGTPAGGEWVALRAYRNATSGSDTMSGDARLIGIKLEYGINAYSD